MKKIILSIMLFLGAKSFAQTNGITYQAVILNPTAAQLPGVNNSNTPMVGKNICLQFQFIDEFSKVEYQETIQVKTDAFGMVNLIIGSGQQTGGYAASFKAIYWSTVAKKLAVGVNVKGSCNTFVEISNQDFSFVPFAYSANNAENVTGVVPIENGGTNATTVIQAKTNLQLQNVNNTSDANKPISAASQNALNLKVDKVTGKVLSTNDYTTPEKTKLAAIIGTNTGDQVLPTLTSLAGVAGNMAITGATKTKVTYDAKGLVTAGADATTADIAPSSNKNYVTDAQAIVIAATSGTNTGDETATTIKTKLGVTTLAGSNTGDQDLTGKVDKVTGKGLSTNDYSTAEKTKLSAITGTNTGDQTTITGNAGTATKLATAIKINGVAFDGSTDITISSAAAGVASAETLTGTTLKSTVTASGLTSVGTLTNLTVTNPIAGSVTGTADNVTGVIAVANGGSGASSLTGYIKGNGTSAFTTLSKIPVTDITAAVQKVNGITPDGNGNVTLAFGNVTTGMLASRPLLAGTNGDIYVISGDATVAENGRTYISDGTAWNEVISNQAATDTRYVKLSGSTMVGNVTFPSGTKATMVDAPTVSTDLVNKTYVDAQATADASGSSKGKIKLAGDLSGTADLPSIANNAILTSKILDGNVTDAKIASLSASKLTGSVAPANGGTGLTAVGTNGQVLTSDGTSLSWASPGASGTTSLNGSTASTQTFAAPGTAGLAPTWSTASGAHTLNIPLASAPSVTAGLLSKADYDNFSAAYTNRITSVTTTGASGAATLVSNVLNIPSPSLDELAGTKAMNTVYAGPISGANTSPTFRALVAADIPILNQNTSGNAATATLATIATNVSGTVAVANGGTGAITLTGLVKGNGTGTMTAAVAGTDYLAPDGSAVNLTNFPVLNQNTLGNAATSTLATTATTAGNVSGTVAVANGGTGAITLTGLVKGNGTGTMTAAVAGTDYLAPNGSAVNLTNFPVLNQNTSGNAATATLATTATTAGNVSGTVAVANGGTGATTLTGLVKGNGTGTMTAAVAGTDYLAPDGSAVNLTNFPVLNQNTLGNAATATLATTATTATNVSGTVAVANGGTGAITLTGLVKGNGTGTMTAAVAGTDYLAPDGSAVNLTNFPVLNQNTLGNAATSTLATTATTAGNVSGTVAVANGGTGAITLTGLVKGNGTGTMTAAVAGTDYLAPTGSAALLTSWPTLNQNTSGNAATATLATLATTATTSTHIAGGLGGTIPYQTAANTTAMLANGNNNQVLTSRGTTLAPVWATSSGVPYTGATAQVDLGAYDLKLQGSTIGLGGGSVAGNTSFGVQALVSNASTAYNNNAVGMYTLWSNTTGLNNTGLGAQAGRQNQTGSSNTSIGSFAMYSSTGAGSNTAVGVGALYSTTSGSNNTAIGLESLRANTTGSNNTGLGYKSAVASAALTNATAIGYNASVDASNTIQLGNTSVTDVKTSGTITAGVVTYPKAHGIANQVLTTNGSGALTWSTASSGVPYTGATGAVNLGAFDLKVNNLTVGNGSGGIASNTAIGSAALYSNTSGHQNTANGNDALNANTTGIANTAIGSAALYSNTAGSGNTANGAKALDFNTVGTYNTAIGYGADVASENLTNATAIGNDAIVGASNTIQLGNTNVTAVKTSGAIIGGNTATSTISGFAANMNAQTGTTYTLLASDNGKIITLTNAAAITLTVPSLFAGFNCMIVQLGAGAVTLTVSGTTISNRSTFTKTAGTNAIATLIALTSTTFISAGDMQ